MKLLRIFVTNQKGKLYVSFSDLKSKNYNMHNIQIYT